jgi:ribose-phosphate pyrophosphokinase
MDLHSDQIRVFDIQDNIYSMPILLGDIWKSNYQNLIVVSPDVGGGKGQQMAKRLDATCIIDKLRPKANVARS